MPPIRRDPPEPRETLIQERIRLALARQGLVIVWRNAQFAAPVAGGFARGGLGTGSADLVGLVKGSGRFVALEVKRPKVGRLSAEQAAFLRIVNEAGGYGCVARSPEEACEHAARAARGERVV